MYRIEENICKLCNRMDLEKAQEPEIKLPTSAGLSKKQEFQRNNYFCFTDYAKVFDCVDNNTLWKILIDGNTRPPYQPPEKLYAGQEATVRTRCGTMDWFQIGKGICQGYIFSSYLFNLYAEYIMQNAGLDEAQACQEKYQ